MKSNVVAANLAPTGALAINEPELDLSNFIVVPNCVLPVGCGQVTTCVSVKTFMPNSANVTDSTAVNDNLLFGVLKSTFINSIINLPSNAVALTLVTCVKLIACAAAVALPTGNVTLYPFNKIFLGVVILQSLVPIIIP